MNILALDSSTEACSVALMVGDELLSRHELAPRRHAELILPFMDELMAEAELTLGHIDALAFGRGPGAFTGIRIATGVIQGIAFAADLPVIPVSTLAAIAQGAARERGAKRVIAAIDARMEEIYWGGFQLGDDGLMQSVAEEGVIAPALAPSLEGEQWTGSGSGWLNYGTVLAERYGRQVSVLDAERLPMAIDVASLALRELRAGNSVEADQALPVYLRDKVAEKKR